MLISMHRQIMWRFKWRGRYWQKCSAGDQTVTLMLLRAIYFKPLMARRGLIDELSCDRRWRAFAKSYWEFIWKYSTKLHVLLRKQWSVWSGQLRWDFTTSTRLKHYRFWTIPSMHVDALHAQMLIKIQKYNMKRCDAPPIAVWHIVTKLQHRFVQIIIWHDSSCT